ncbi:MAG: SDR family oxidoreductase [Magnetospirillum sp.]|nr:SDR family oxidoreductase [Magnetospirillum sp.]
MNSSRKVALVTGASRGIGAEIACRLAADGFAVAVNYAGNAAKADAVVAQIAAAGGEAIAVQADIGEEAAVDRLFQAVLERFGRLDAVVNNAGLMANSPIAAGDVAAFDRLVATNLRGTFLVLSRAARHVGEGGRIVAFSTSVIAKSLPSYGAYIATKAGVEGLVRVLANEMRGRSVTVNAVAPGPVATELFLTGKSDELVAQLAKAAPLERLGQPEDISGVVSFLLGPDGGWVNGQVLRANGGFA